MGEFREVVLDADVGIDDALMILGLVSEPAVEIVAIGATHGNCTAANSARNALRTLEAVGIHSVPVALGLESPLHPPRSAPQVHGHDGLGDLGLPEPRGQVTGEPAQEQLVRLGLERPGMLDLIAVGSLSNLAAALALDPWSLKRYRSVTFLGTLSQYPKPIVPDYNDANVYFDPDASRAVLSSDTPMTIVPIDLSRRAGRPASGCVAYRYVSASDLRLEDLAVLLQLLSGTAGTLVGVDARSARGRYRARSNPGHRGGRATDRGRTVWGPGARGGAH